MLQDFVQVDLLGAGVRKRCAPPFVHAPPPRPVVPRPRSPTLPLFPHLGAPWIPQPRFLPPPPLARSTLRPVCASPFSHTLRASAVCFPGCTAHRSVPLPFARGPLARSSPAAWPLRARTPCVRPSPDAWPPLPLRRFRCACKRGGGRAGGAGHGGEGGHGGGAQPGWRGLPAHERGGGTVPCASPACVQRGRWADEARRVVNRGAGMAKPGRRGERKVEVRTAPPAPLPAFAQRVGEGARARRVAWGRGEGEQPRRRHLLANEKGGGTLCLPCPQRACKGGGGRAGGAGCNPGRGDCCPRMERRGVAHCSSCAPGMRTKGRARQGGVGQGEGQDRAGRTVRAMEGGRKGGGQASRAAW